MEKQKKIEPFIAEITEFFLNCGTIEKLWAVMPPNSERNCKMQVERYPKIMEK